jgi:hypothetical protein
MGDPDDDIARVRITVSPLVPISDKGAVKFVASVQLDVGGIMIQLDGWSLRMGRDGRMRCFTPGYRDFRTGEWTSCITLSADLLRAVGEALLGQEPGGAVLVRRPGGA